MSGNYGGYPYDDLNKPKKLSKSLERFNKKTSTNTPYGDALKDMFAGRKPKIRY